MTFNIQTPLTPQAIERVNPSLARAVPAPPPVHARDTLMLVGAPEAKHATYQDICAVPTPEPTYHENTGNYSYRPVAYATLADGLRDHMTDVLGANPVYETYALSGGQNPGSQMFGRMAWESDIAGMMIEVVLRSSMNQTFCGEWGIGTGTFICANGMISADQVMKIKHTHNFMERFAASLTDGSRGMEARIEAARKRAQWVDGLREIPMSNELFIAFIGLLWDRGVIGPQKMSAARKYWNACHAGQLHDDHAGNNLFAGYQAVTGAQHRSNVRNVMHSATGIDWMTEKVIEQGGAPVGLPEWRFEMDEF